MNKTNNKSIILSTGILALFIFGLISVPTQTNAANSGYIQLDGYSSVPTQQTTTRADNPKPLINSISPSSSDVGVGTKTITITGDGFIPSSVARINGSNRAVTFIDSSHLLMQITGNDTYAYQANGGFYITIFNGAPGGGYSNAQFFTINNVGVTNDANTNTQDNSAYSNFIDGSQTQNPAPESESNNGLASNSIFATNGILPSSLVQWIFFAILVLLIVILVRKIYGGTERYHAIPLKHD